MKKILLTLAPLLFILTAKAQITDSARNSHDKLETKTITVNTDVAIFSKVDQMPEYPGGIDEFYKFLEKKLRYPATARENNTQGKIIVTMVVEKDGSLSQVTVAKGKGIGSGCDEEAVRLVKLSAPWKPGMLDGRAVRVMYSVPVSFALAN